MFMLKPQMFSEFRHYRSHRLSIAIGSILLYIILFFLVHHFYRFTGLPILAVIPVIVIAWLYGSFPGIAAGLLSVPVNILMLTSVGISWIDNMLKTGGAIVGTFGFTVIALIVGRLSDLGQRLRKELVAKQAIEKELKLHRDNLEELVNSKTRELQESRERFKAIAENSPDAIIITDAMGIILFCNRGTEEMFGYDQEEMLGQSSIIFLPPQKRESELSKRIKYAQSGEHLTISATIESIMVRKNGTEFPVEFSLYSWQMNNESFFATVMRDITARKRAEKELKDASDALRRSRDFFENVFNAAGDGIYVTDELGFIVFANKTLCDMLGYELSELIGRPAVDITADIPNQPLDPAMEHEMYHRDYTDYFETFFLRKDGSTLPVESKVTNVREGHQSSPAIIVILRDITERKRAENEIRQARDYLENLFRTSPDAIIVTGADGTIIMANESVFDVFGYHPDEIIGQHATIFTPDSQEAAQAGIQYMEDLFETGYLRNCPTERKRKDGSVIQVETSAVLMKDSSGSPLGAISSSRDVTDRKRLEEQLRQSQKMEAVGTLAGGIAHDFNNILGIILGYAELSKDQAAGNDILDKNLSQILKAANRAKDLVRQILAFSRKTESEVKPLQLHTVIAEALKLLRASLPSTITIRQDIDETGDIVVADATEIHQVVMNLCTNAAHAMQAAGGVMEIMLKSVDLDAHAAQHYSEIAPGPYVQLSVKDTGTGIPADIIGRIFEPFFTTKEIGRGTGMGLAMVHGIVKRYKGDVKVYSEPGRGAVFHVVLPRVQAETGNVHAIEREAPRGSERVLLVDDEAVLLDVGEKILSSLGYRVTATGSAVEALEMFKKSPEVFDLVITDQTMPNLTGYELAQRFMEIRAGIPVVLCTGYSDLVTAESASAGGIKAYVIKPLNRLALAETIRKVLGKSTA
jgi:PAS domain S-box-containing protein